ncbi:MAG: cell wall hydrolase [Desulfotomaculaceae bacterium]|nr:cell wall hydrolase [Desulfotomaculaceae bacterium]
MSKFVPKLAVRLVILMMMTSILLGVNIPGGECNKDLNAQLKDRSDSVMVSCTIQKGDTLYDIAMEYKVPVPELMRANNLSGSLIIPGQVLVLPGKNAGENSLSRRNVSREDLMLLARVIHAEARGESFEGQVAVGAVILNRLANPHFPKTIREIIYQRNNLVYQFSPVGDGSIKLEPNERAVQAAVQALDGNDPTGGALFFYNPDISSDKWIRTLPVMTRIGNHVFATSSI